MCYILTQYYAIVKYICNMRLPTHCNSVPRNIDIDKYAMSWYYIQVIDIYLLRKILIRSVKI